MKGKQILAIELAAMMLAAGAALAQWGASGFECEDASGEAESAAYDLARSTKALHQCARGGDFSDDCGGEFRDVRGDYDEYEAAVSDYVDYCE